MREMPIVVGRDNLYTVWVFNSMDGSPLPLSAVSAIDCVFMKEDGTKTIPAEVNTINAERAIIQVWVKREDAANITSGEVYLMDLKVTFADGKQVNIPTPPLRFVAYNPVT